MAPQEAPSVITLKVKVPPGAVDSGHDDIALGSLNVSTTIGSIRRRLQELVESHPNPERQRLLYGGRVLSDDEQTLADALNTRRDPSQTDFVIHLIIRGDGLNSTVNHGTTHSATVPTPPGVANASAAPTGQAQQPLQQAHGIGPHGIIFGNVPHGPGIPEHARAAFSHAIAQGQQQRAAMGMQGVGFQPVGQPDPRMTNAQMAAENTTDGQQAAERTTGTDGAPNAQQPGPRSLSSQGFHLHGVGPDGQRFQVHHQTFNFPNLNVPTMPVVGHMHPTGAQQSGAIPQLPHLHHAQHLQHLQHLAAAGLPTPIQQLPSAGQQRTQSALDAARENMAIMQGTLEELSEANTMTEDQRAQLRDVQDRATALNNYIDPLHLGQRGTPPFMLPMFQTPIPRTQPHLHDIPQQVSTVAQSPNPGSNGDVVCYLLASPQGPQALLFSPLHGTFRAGNPLPLPSAGFLSPTPTTTAGSQAAGINHEAGAGRAPAEQPGEAAQAMQQLQRLQEGARGLAQPDNNAFGAAQPLAGHFWLLFRILVFAYFVLGSDLGWRRPLALAAIGLGFWLMRLGPFANDGIVRRWWDGVMALPPQNRADVQPEGLAGAGNDGQPRQPMPTPAQLAERLLAERNRNREARWQRIHEWIRPVERAIALFIASLWPGIGEAHVEATERAERRRLTEETEARVREEQERARIEAEQQGGEPTGSKDQPSDGQGEQGQRNDGENVATNSVADIKMGEPSTTTAPTEA